MNSKTIGSSAVPTEGVASGEGAASVATGDASLRHSVEAAETVWSLNGEDFIYDELDDALDALYNLDELAVGRVIEYGTAERPNRDWVTADDVIEQIGERAYDECGEWAEDFPSVSNEARAELSAFLSAWQATHCTATFWTVRNAKKYAVTAEDITDYYAERPAPASTHP